ncbi:MAG: SiaB family protein kinase [Flavobacteriales bacterium]|nr:SiaB family protein kinase [Flavobacteriales bacterium]
MESLFEYYKELENDRLSFIFNGDVSDDITDGIIRITEFNVNNFEAFAKLSKRISFIMVECFQNVVRHGVKPEKEKEKSAGLFATRLLGDANYVSSINLIDMEEVDLLSEKLTQLNTLEKDKLKALYLEVLNNEELSAKGGAGLGLIQLARKAGQPISFDFETRSKDLSDFYLSLKLTNKDGETKPGEALRFTKDFDKKIKDSDVLMIYKGDFGKDSIMPIIQIMEEKMKTEGEEGGSKAFFMILVELLQNVSRHNISNKNKDGIFMVAEDPQGNYWTSVGNVVDGATKDQLIASIEQLNELDAVGLKQAYKKTLREGSFSDKGGAGLGLIEIARKSSDKLSYSFDEQGDDRYFFTFNVKF